MAIFVTLVNRTSKNLVGTWDGKQYTIKPGKHEFPEHMANKFKEQNPVMGSGNPNSWPFQKDYLIGILDYHDPIDPIEQSGAIEIFDRSQLPASQQEVVVEKVTGIYSKFDDAPLPVRTASNFEAKD